MPTMGIIHFLTYILIIIMDLYIQVLIPYFWGPTEGPHFGF